MLPHDQHMAHCTGQGVVSADHTMLLQVEESEEEESEEDSDEDFEDE